MCNTYNRWLYNLVLKLPANVAGAADARREQPLYRNVKRFRGGLVFKAHKPVSHSTLGSRVIKKKKGLMKES
jgi:hypothetical protein